MKTERINIGIFGKMNAGKSSILNLLTQNNTSIVDPKPGTTADIKTAPMEIHGLGPVMLFDTAGIDEEGELGAKKRAKTISVLKEADLVLIVIDPANTNISEEEKLIMECRDLDKQVLIIYNIFNDRTKDKNIPELELSCSMLRFYRKISLKANKDTDRSDLIDFILNNFEKINLDTPLFPAIEENEFYVLNIPMDDETPEGRFLRPQAMAEEYITRRWAYPVSFRMNLGEARSPDYRKSTSEKNRFLDFLDCFRKKPKMIITDSQAMDIMSKICPKDIMLTTFSVMMANYMSRGRLGRFVEGAGSLNNLKAGDNVLIVEACNHSRISEDIGTVQIPALLNKNWPGVNISHNFGREFQENKQLSKYNLIIQCGGCMISQQKFLARLRDLDALSIPYTNYGIFLSYMQGGEILKKVTEPWLTF